MPHSCAPMLSRAAGRGRLRPGLGHVDMRAGGGDILLPAGRRKNKKHVWHTCCACVVAAKQPGHRQPHALPPARTMRCRWRASSPPAPGTAAGVHHALQVVVDEATGRLLTDSTWSYKIPTPDLIPRRMNVHFLRVSQPAARPCLRPHQRCARGAPASHPPRPAHAAWLASSWAAGSGVAQSPDCT
jgi:hypothetical protein